MIPGKVNGMPVTPVQNLLKISTLMLHIEIWVWFAEASAGPQNVRDNTWNLTDNFLRDPFIGDHPNIGCTHEMLA